MLYCMCTKQSSLILGLQWSKVDAFCYVYAVGTSYYAAPRYTIYVFYTARLTLILLGHITHAPKPETHMLKDTYAERR